MSKSKFHDKDFAPGLALRELSETDAKEEVNNIPLI